MRYLILVYRSPGSRAAWEGLSEDQRVEFGRGQLALTEDLAASGELIVSAGLADPSLARRVWVREGRTMATGGPFAEAKEHPAGFYLIECEGTQGAVEHAARAPGAACGEVEVWPVLDLGGLEL